VSRRFLISAVVTAVVLSLVGLLAPRVVRSPAQVAADRAAPALPVATAEVERRVLADTVTFRGKVTTLRRHDVTAEAPPGSRAVVTAVPVEPGDTVRSGTVLVEVSGRPILLLEGALPAYRDLTEGDRGPDVAQLQQSLRGLGYSVGDAAGRWGASTSAAVRALYGDRGFRAPGGPQPSLPVAEVVFLSGLPGRVATVTAEVGAEAEESLMTVAAGRAVVTGVLAPGDGALVRPGQKVRVGSEVVDDELRGTVATVGELQTGEGPPGFPVTVRLAGTVDRDLYDRDVRVTVTSASSDDEVLVVPLSAVTAQADGSSVVRVVRDDSRDDDDSELVTVRLGLVADGYAAVRPPSDGALEPGDLVVVGAAPSGAGAGAVPGGQP
jgi:peptidoglycan hydrolase-like protein with peptidoglycan-binding domain